MRVNKVTYKIEANINTKICHISDIHYSENYNNKRFNIIVDNIKNINPNYVCITGDIIDSSNCKHLNPLYDFITQLGQISKVIIILGNHDINYIENNNNVYYINEEYIKKISNIDNVVLLRNTIYIDNDISFCGLELSYEQHMGNEEINYESINNKLKTVNNKFNIVLMHNPEVFLNGDYNTANIDLILCGHTHGGLLPDFIPGHFGIISPNKKLFAKNMRGMYNINKTKLIISSAIMKLSKRSNLMLFNDIYSMNINIIEVIKS